MVKDTMTTKGDMVGTGSEQDAFRSLNVKVLIKTFKLLHLEVDP